MANGQREALKSKEAKRRCFEAALALAVGRWPLWS
jgi:hypothetical protein